MTEQVPVPQEQSSKAEQLPVPREQSTKPQRFVEKGPQVLFDTKTQLYWLKKDSWQDKGKFINWHEAREYADKKNIRKIGGFDDWRLPNFDEAASLYDEASENPAKGGGSIHLDTIFPEGAFKVSWLMGDTSTRRPRFDYVQGKETATDEYSFGAVRLCRKDKINKNRDAPQRRK